ncbi:MAG: hypothetical protein AB7L28_01330 [Kofleriaceae bacterium]
MICAVACGVAALGGCGKSATEAAKEEAMAEEAKDMAQKKADAVPAKKVSPPVPGDKMIPCEQLIDVEKFREALGETEPLTLRDQIKSEGDAVSSCGLIRGGKKLTTAQQQALLKKQGRLGVLAGDEICRVTAFCRTIEDPDAFRNNYCKKRKEIDDESMGTYACRQVVPTGADDVFVFRFLDADTKCILQVSGGPSQVDNDVIRTCAKVARDTIGPAQIALDGSAPPPAAPSAGSADSAGSGT